MSDDMLGDIDGAVTDGDPLVGEWSGFKVAYANGDVVGNKAILDAADTWSALDTSKEPQSVIWKVRGELFYQIILKRNPDSDESIIKAMANQKWFDGLIAVWSQQ